MFKQRVDFTNRAGHVPCLRLALQIRPKKPLGKHFIVVPRISRQFQYMQSGFQVRVVLSPTFGASQAGALQCLDEVRVELRALEVIAQ